MNVLKSALVVAVMLAFGTAARTEEEKIAIDKVPAKVMDAVKAKFKDAQVTGAEKETEKGKVSYEINITNKGQKIDVIVSEEGKITAVESIIDVKDVPKVVIDALMKKYPEAKIKQAEEINKDEKITYELIITAGDKKLEVVFDPEGKFLTEEDMSKEEKKK